ncbi:MAG: ABC transporter permease subunit [Anaerolineae bacterium]|nr:ABC transporter permease subunit [Anaerolineae bacterium]
MRVRAIIDKEWEEIVRNRSVFWSLVLLPLVLTVIFLAILFFMRLEVQRTGSLRSNSPIPAHLAAYRPADAVQIMILNQFLMYFLMAPMALPIYVAAHSIIGEKQARSLEPLLATPVKTWELLLAKSVAAAVPPIIAAWVSYGLFALGASFLVSPVVLAEILHPAWVLSIVILSPLFAMLSVFVGVIASSRMNDPRAAQQWSALFLIPAIAAGMAMMLGVIRMSLLTLLLGAAAVAIADAVVLWFAVRLFQREVILTRWR